MLRVVKERNILHTIKRRKVKVSNILNRNCLLKHVIGEQIERTEDKEDDVSSYWITLTH